ncbi:MAG: hypothetical protein HRU36_04655 [Rickettsiales bacterium]|nr:hypothetical protein [Rickettsiales bacterium]
MQNNFKPEKKNLIKNKVSNILDELSMQHESEFIEEDMVALFEDIAKLFAGREEEFLNFENMSEDAKLAIYNEIKTIIILLKKMKGSSDKEMVMEMLGKNLAANFDKYSKEFISVTDQLNKQEQKNLKRRFADVALIELYKKRQAYLSQNRQVPQKLKDEIENYVKRVSSKKVVTRPTPPPYKGYHKSSNISKRI